MDRAHAGFTLLEITLVLALMVIVYALAMPALRGSLASHRLHAAAEQVRVDWSNARVAAMRSGQTQVFTCRPETAAYQMAPWTQNGDDGAATDAETSDRGPLAAARSRRLRELPVGVQLVEVTTTDSRSQGLQADGDNGAFAVYFFPDGTTSRARLVLSNARGERAAIRLRDLTGISELEPDDS